MNYAAPANPVGGEWGPGRRGGGDDHDLNPPFPSPRDFSELSEEVKMSERFTTTMINGHPATAPFEPHTNRMGARVGTRNHVRGGTGMGVGIGLHWPWGSLSDALLNDAERNDEREHALDDLALVPPIVAEPGKDVFPVTQLRPSSPPKQRRGSPPSSSSSSPSSSRDSSPSRRRPSPPNGRGPSPYFHSGTPPDARRDSPSPSHSSDPLYDAILKKWCFAQSSPSGANHSSGVSTSPPLGLSAV
jgi:hypothetical protein